jgi:hypothetical protein
MASASPHRGGETPLDRPRAHCPGAAAVKNRVGDLLAYTPSYELLVVCLAANLVFGSWTGVVSRPPAAALIIGEGQRVTLEGLVASQAAPHRQV